MASMRRMTRREREWFLERVVAIYGEGWLYLIELERPIGDVARPRCSARYYLGWCKSSPELRLVQHRRGDGARMLAWCNEAGVGYRLIATWRGTIADEWRLKRAGHFDRLAGKVRGLNLPGP